ncbi:MAG: GTP-binding protein [Hyphomicrobiales bacterium]
MVVLDKPLTVSIITGFLGAGKTTLLNRLLVSPDMANAAVIINEFGDVSLDHLLVESGDDDIIELSSGCLCCTIRGELVETLERLLDRPDANRLTSIVIETTGLADPVPVMQAVMAHPLLSQRLSLGSVVTLIDAVNGVTTLEHYEEARKQVAVADQLLISKIDMATDTTALKSAIFQLNPNITPINVVDVSEAELVEQLSTGLFEMGEKADIVQAWFGENDHHHDHHHHDQNRHGETIRSFSLVRERPIEHEALRAFLDLLAAQHGPKLLRVKGLIHVVEHSEQPVLIHGVQSIFHPPRVLDKWPSAERVTKIVFIADGLDESFIQRLFDGFSGTPQIDQADSAAMMDNPLAISGYSKSRQS